MSYIYRKIPVISPGLMNFVRGSGWAYKRRGLHPRELIRGINVSKQATAVLIEIRF